MIVHHTIDSPHLAGNLLGDPSTRDVFVYLPPAYGSTSCSYPTVYLLHWFGTTAARVVTPSTEDVRWRPRLEDVLNPVFSRMGAKDVIVVIPDGWSTYGCSQWVDSPVNGNFEQYVLHDVIPHVDSSFRTVPHSTGRAVTGFSSGGFGAWHLATRNPEVFGAVAVLSGDSYFDLTHKPMVYGYFNSIWPGPPAGPVEGDEPSAMAYALAASYSPNPDKPPFFVDFPLDWSDGTIVEPVWRRWLSYDMVHNFADRLDNLRRLRGILLDCGRHDEYAVQWGHRLLSRRLTVAGIQHDAVEHPGNHSGRAPERHQLALRWLSDVLYGRPGGERSTTGGVSERIQGVTRA